MNRKQLYNEITSLGLQEEVKSKYGKNYTMCSNADLQKVIDEVHKGLDKLHKGGFGVNCGSICKLVDILAKKKILLKSEVEAIMNA